MKITKQQLKRIIKEEYRMKQLLNESPWEYVKDILDPHGLFTGAGMGIDEDVLQSIATPDAWIVFKALAGPGTKEKVLNDVFARRRSEKGGLVALSKEFQTLLNNLQKQRGSARTNIIKVIYASGLALGSGGISAALSGGAVLLGVNQLQKAITQGQGLEHWLRDDGEDELSDEVVNALKDKLQPQTNEPIKENKRNKKMKITKQELKRIIKEELKAVLEKKRKGEKRSSEVDPYERALEAPLAEEDDKWIQGAEEDIEKRGTEGVCTGDKFGGPTCKPGTKRYNLAKTFRKMAKDRKKKK
jgi:hypothetical protein